MRSRAAPRTSGTTGCSATKEPSFTIIYSRCVHLGCPVQPNGPKFEDKKDVQGRDAHARARRPASAARATAAPTTPRATAPPARPSARSTATPSRSSTATSSSATTSASAPSRARARTRRSAATARPTRACTSTASSAGSIRSRFRGPDDGQVRPPGADREGRSLPARLGRGAHRPRRLHEVVPLPQRPARRQLDADARRGDADRVPRPGDHRRRSSRCTTSPIPNSAYESIQNITNEVTLGWLVRGMHKWGASVFIILMFLHMARTFLFGAYKYPRELNWIIGVLLLVHGHARGLHRLPAAVGSDGVLGDRRRDQPQRDGADRRARSSRSSSRAARRSARTRCRSSTRSTCS